MMDYSKYNRFISNAIKSLYQLIMLINVSEGKGLIIDLNTELSYLNGKDDYGLFCDTLYKNIHPEDRESFRDFMSTDNIPDSFTESVFTSMECRIRHEKSGYFWSELIFCNAGEEDRAGGNEYLLLIRDIHDIKNESLKRESEERHILRNLQKDYDTLFEENMKDQQTGCYNRKGLRYYSEIVIKEAKDSGKHIFVCVADLNGLKYMNDTFGHAAGDEAISVVSSALLASAPEGSRIVRTGGDEFLLFAAIDRESREPSEMEKELKGIISSYNESHNNPFEIGVSYGWILEPYRDGMIALDEYVEKADKLMYEMKNATDKHRRI